MMTSEAEGGNGTVTSSGVTGCHGAGCHDVTSPTVSTTHQHISPGRSQSERTTSGVTGNFSTHAGYSVARDTTVPAGSTKVPGPTTAASTRFAKTTYKPRGTNTASGEIDNCTQTGSGL